MLPGFVLLLAVQCFAADPPIAQLSNGVVLRGTWWEPMPGLKVSGLTSFLMCSLYEASLAYLLGRANVFILLKTLTGRSLLGMQQPMDLLVFKYHTLMILYVTPVVFDSKKVPRQFSEDCLFLDIYAPVSDKPLPVMVWIYGGSFVSG